MYMQIHVHVHGVHTMSPLNSEYNVHCTYVRGLTYNRTGHLQCHKVNVPLYTMLLYMYLRVPLIEGLDGDVGGLVGWR